MSTYLIVDIDRTIANNDHRAHLVECDKPDWKAFLAPELVALDNPIPSALKAFNKIANRPIGPIIFLTGRSESLRTVTSEWILKHFDIVVNENSLLMRPNSDWSDVPSACKEKLFLKYVYTQNSEDSYMCFDDDLNALKMYEKYNAWTFEAPGCWDTLFPNYPAAKESEKYWRR